MTTPVDPAVLYPDIAAHGTLAAALQDAARGGLDGVPVTSPKGRDQVLRAQVVSVVAHRDPLDITAARGERQWTVCGRERFQGVAMVYSASSDLAQVAAVARGWHDGTSLDGIERAAAFACLTGRFEVPELDPVAVAESEWRHLRLESAKLESQGQLALFTSQSSVSTAVREALSAPDVHENGQHLGGDYWSAVCCPAERQGESAGYGRRWHLPSRRCREPESASRSREHRFHRPAGASRSHRQLPSELVNKARQPAYQALVEAAYAEPCLRALYPFTSHWTLRFSTTIRPGMTITGPCLHIDQSGTYAVSKNLYGQGEYGRYTAPGEACAAAARRLPSGLGPVTLSST